MIRLLITALLMVLLLLSAGAEAQVTVPAKTTITFNQVPCPGGSLCNNFHIRLVKNNGVVVFEKAFASTSQAANFRIEIPTRKGTMMIWSDR